MKRNCLVLIFLFMLLLTASAFALTADVSMRIRGELPNGNPLLPQMWVGNDNVLEFWITNSAKLKGMTLGVLFTNSGALTYSLVQPYGTLPYVDDGGDPPIQDYSLCIMKEHGTLNNFLKTFGAGSCSCTFGLDGAGNPDPNVLFFGGADAALAQAKNLYAHLTSVVGYSVKIHIPDGQPDGTFCVMPVYVPPAGDWLMDGSVNVDSITHVPSGAAAPNFQGHTPDLVLDGQGHAWPSCPPACFYRGAKPCGAPTFLDPVPGAAVTSSHAGYTFTFNATVGDPTATWLGWSANMGSIVGPMTAGVFTLSPGNCPSQGPSNVIVTASNTCPAHTDYPFTITWTNANPVIDCPTAPVIATVNGDKLIPFTATDADAGDAANLTWSATGSLGGGTYSFTGNVLTIHPTVTGTFSLTITATDMCGGVSAPCVLVINAVAYDIVKIPKLGDGGEFVFQGTYTHVPVYLTGSALSLAGYNLLIHYDASALRFVSATIGAPLGPCPNGSGWEYFTYRFGGDGNCGGPCPSGLLRIVALAETNNGANHPGCNGTKDPFNIYGVIADLKFYVTNDRNFECQYTEIGFAWIDCGDNTFSDPTGNILYVAAENAVHTFEWKEDKALTENLIPCVSFPNMIGVVYGGFCPKGWHDPLYMGCNNANPNKQVSEKLYFWNGGIDIACADSIDARGDINLNGVANEIADAVLFTNFFLQGITAFTINVQGQVAATDINADGRPLTVGDLVYLLRIVVGDALPILKLSPFAGGATVNFADGSVSTESVSEIGAVYATFAINGAYSISSNTNMEVKSAEANGELKVLVYSGMSNLSNRIASGTNELFTVSGNVELKSVEAADYYGNMLNTRVNKISLPTSFALSQNVPNPFNPTTKLGFALPNQTEWTLSIYNVAGQLVKNFSGNNIGNVSVEWDASMAPSGVYFYKLNAGSYSDTKKMVLMK